MELGFVHDIHVGILDGIELEAVDHMELGVWNLRCVLAVYSLLASTYYDFTSWRCMIPF